MTWATGGLGKGLSENDEVGVGLGRGKSGMLERDEAESYNSCQLAPFTFPGELRVVIVEEGRHLLNDLPCQGK